MGGGGKGTSSQNSEQQSTFQPPAWLLEAGQQAIQSGEVLQQSPFQIPVQPMAGFAPQQAQAFQEVQNMQGMTQPFMQAGATLNTLGAMPNIGQYFGAESQGVMGELQNLDAQQMAQVTGNAATQAGGLGADRIGVAQSQLANQQNLAAGATLAGLMGQSVGQAQTGAQLEQSAGNNIANIGNTAQTAGLQGAQAELAAGSLQQQQQQNISNSQYQNVLQQIGWPYQTDAFLAEMASGMAPTMGGTGTSTGFSTMTSSPLTQMGQMKGLTGGMGSSLMGMGMKGSGGRTPGHPEDEHDYSEDEEGNKRFAAGGALYNYPPSMAPGASPWSPSNPANPGMLPPGMSGALRASGGYVPSTPTHMQKGGTPPPPPATEEQPPPPYTGPLEPNFDTAPASLPFADVIATPSSVDMTGGTSVQDIGMGGAGVPVNWVDSQPMGAPTEGQAPLSQLGNFFATNPMVFPSGGVSGTGIGAFGTEPNMTSVQLQFPSPTPPLSKPTLPQLNTAGLSPAQITGIPGLKAIPPVPGGTHAPAGTHAGGGRTRLAVGGQGQTSVIGQATTPPSVSTGAPAGFPMTAYGNYGGEFLTPLGNGQWAAPGQAGYNPQDVVGAMYAGLNPSATPSFWQGAMAQQGGGGGMGGGGYGGQSFVMSAPYQTPATPSAPAPAAPPPPVMPQPNVVGAATATPNMNQTTSPFMSDLQNMWSSLGLGPNTGTPGSAEMSALDAFSGIGQLGQGQGQSGTGSQTIGQLANTAAGNNAALGLMSSIPSPQLGVNFDTGGRANPFHMQGGGIAVDHAGELRRLTAERDRLLNAQPFDAGGSTQASSLGASPFGQPVPPTDNPGEGVTGSSGQGMMFNPTTGSPTQPGGTQAAIPKLNIQGKPNPAQQWTLQANQQMAQQAAQQLSSQQGGGGGGKPGGGGGGSPMAGGPDEAAAPSAGAIPDLNTWRGGPTYQDGGDVPGQGSVANIPDVDPNIPGTMPGFTGSFGPPQHEAPVMGSSANIQDVDPNMPGTMPGFTGSFTTPFDSNQGHLVGGLNDAPSSSGWAGGDDIAFAHGPSTMPHGTNFNTSHVAGGTDIAPVHHHRRHHAAGGRHMQDGGDMGDFEPNPVTGGYMQPPPPPPPPTMGVMGTLPNSGPNASTEMMGPYDAMQVRAGTPQLNLNPFSSGSALGTQQEAPSAPPPVSPPAQTAGTSPGSQSSSQPVPGVLGLPGSSTPYGPDASINQTARYGLESNFYNQPAGQTPNPVTGGFMENPQVPPGYGGGSPTQVPGGPAGGGPVPQVPGISGQATNIPTPQPNPFAQGQGQGNVPTPQPRPAFGTPTPQPRPDSTQQQTPGIQPRSVQTVPQSRPAGMPTHDIGGPGMDPNRVQLQQAHVSTWPRGFTGNMADLDAQRAQHPDLFSKPVSVGNYQVSHVDWTGLQKAAPQLFGGTPQQGQGAQGGMSQNYPAKGYGLSNVAPLQATAGRNPDIKNVNPALVNIMSAAATHLPPGYKVTVNEGYNASGHVGASQHHIKGQGALDLQITDPQGHVIPNEGNDSTGMYRTLARAALGEQRALYPDLNGKLAWGGAFETTPGSGVSDLMHFDLGGERGHFAQNLPSVMGPLGGGARPGGGPRQMIAQGAPQQPAAGGRGISPSYLNFAKFWEGFNPKAYADGAQTSIGYGTKARPGETSISEPEAAKRLEADLYQAQGQVNQHFPNAPPGWKMALTDLAFNAGDRALEGNGLGDAIRAQDWHKATQIYSTTYTHTPGMEKGLQNRRAAMLKLAGQQGSQPQTASTAAGPAAAAANQRGIQSIPRNVAMNQGAPRPPANVGARPTGTQSQQAQAGQTHEATEAEFQQYLKQNGSRTVGDIAREHGRSVPFPFGSMTLSQAYSAEPDMVRNAFAHPDQQRRGGRAA